MECPLSRTEISLLCFDEDSRIVLPLGSAVRGILSRKRRWFVRKMTAAQKSWWAANKAKAQQILKKDLHALVADLTAAYVPAFQKETPQFASKGENNE